MSLGQVVMIEQSESGAGAGSYHMTVREWHWGMLISYDNPRVALGHVDIVGQSESGTRAGSYHMTVREWHWSRFKFRISVSPISHYCLNVPSSLSCFQSASTLLRPRSSAAT